MILFSLILSVLNPCVRFVASSEKATIPIGVSCGRRSMAMTEAAFSEASGSPDMLPEISSTNTTSTASGLRMTTLSRNPDRPVSAMAAEPRPWAQAVTRSLAW